MRGQPSTLVVEAVEAPPPLPLLQACEPPLVLAVQEHYVTVFEVRLAPLEGWGQHGSELIVLWAAVTSTGQREVTDQLHTVLAIYIRGGGAGRGSGAGARGTTVE